MSVRKLPKLVVFDLDFTLWDLQVDKCSLPFSKILTGNIRDSAGNEAALYSEVMCCLKLLRQAQIPMAIASRISDVAGAYQLLYLFDIKCFFKYIEIYPTGKRLHFRRLSRKSGISFEDIVFFDDDYRNIRDISKLGVACNLVESGLNIRTLLTLVPLEFTNHNYNEVK